METTDKNDIHELVDEVMLREIADTVGRQMAKDYASNIEGVTSVLNDEGVELHISTTGPYRDIKMQFVSPEPVGYSALHICDDSEL